jgi:pimeloyl-ACP methyl ester carboxylesterase
MLSTERAMGTVDVQGLTIGYVRSGEGPPLVLLHGYVGDGATTWQRQIAEFENEFEVVAWDAPGAGGSSDPPEPFGIDGYADCLAAFIEVLDLQRPHVVGLSFGGALALALFRRHGSIPASLVLASGYAGWAGSLPGDVAEQRLAQARALAEMAPDDLVATLLPTMFSARVPPEIVEQFGASIRDVHPAGFRAMADASAESVRDVLPAITVPTLLVYGDRDVRAPLSVAEDLHAAIAGSTLVVLPDTGHVCNIEAAEEFNAALREFLHAVPR